MLLICKLPGRPLESHSHFVAPPPFSFSELLISLRSSFSFSLITQVSCIAISRSGRYLASGQVTHMGFTAPIMLWDLESGKLLHKMSLHKVKVQALSFSCDDRFLSSLGGADDNSLVLWDVASGESVCGSPTHNDFTQLVKFFNRNSKMLVTGKALQLLRF